MLFFLNNLSIATQNKPTEISEERRMAMQRFIVKQGNFEVMEFPGESFCKVPGAVHNGQHWQAPGKILVQLESDDERGAVFSLFHPKTNGVTTGHVDIIFAIHGKNAELRRYSGMKKISLRSALFKMFWPDGPNHLIETLRSLGGSFIKNHQATRFGRIVILAANSLN